MSQFGQTPVRCYSPRRERSQGAAARKTLGAKFHRAYRDQASMLKEFAPHLTVVGLEAAAAPAAIDAALDAGCHVFAEKPSCTMAADFEKLVRKAEVKHRHLMMAFANRSHAPVREARRLIQVGTLGKVYGAEAHLVTDQTRLKSPEYRKSWFCIKAKAGGGQLTWVGIHWLDLLLHVSGLKVKDVAGFAGVVGGQPIDVEDSAALSMRFDNGGHGTLLCGYYLTLERSVRRLDDGRLSWGHEHVLEVVNEKAGSATQQLRITVAP